MGEGVAYKSLVIHEKKAVVNESKCTIKFFDTTFAYDRTWYTYVYNVSKLTEDRPINFLLST